MIVAKGSSTWKQKRKVHALMENKACVLEIVADLVGSWDKERKDMLSEIHYLYKSARFASLLKSFCPDEQSLLFLAIFSGVSVVPLGKRSTGPPPAASALGGSTRQSGENYHLRSQ